MVDALESLAVAADAVEEQRWGLSSPFVQEQPRLALSNGEWSFKVLWRKDTISGPSFPAVSLETVSFGSLWTRATSTAIRRYKQVAGLALLGKDVGTWEWDFHARLGWFIVSAVDESSVVARPPFASMNFYENEAIRRLTLHPEFKELVGEAGAPDMIPGFNFDNKTLEVPWESWPLSTPPFNPEPGSLF